MRNISMRNLATVLTILAAACRAQHMPEQIHIALGASPTSQTAMWVTEPDGDVRSPPCSTVEYGTSSPMGGMRQIAIGEATEFRVPVSWEVNGGDFVRSNISRTIFVHKATMHGLKPLTRYFYRVGCEATAPQTGWSSVLSFTSQQDGHVKRWPIRIAWLGDMGDTNGRSFPALQEEAQSGMLDAAIHVGDIAYDLDTIKDARRTGDTGLSGGKGDEFMRDLQPVASAVPYMVCPGNHETNFNFTAYTHRFNGMPSNAEPLPAMAGLNIANMSNNWWYSYNVGNAHIVSLNAPASTLPSQYTKASRYKWDYPKELGWQQYRWLAQDLKAARANTSAPWIFVYSHYPMYCSNGGYNTSGTGDCGWLANIMRNGLQAFDGIEGGAPGWEALLQQYKVDMYIAAHVHNYERILPVYNGTSDPKWMQTPNRIEKADAPVHVVTGSAGNVELQEGFDSPIPFSYYRTLDYGYNRMLIHNNTHLEWLYVNVTGEQGYGEVTDHMWLIK